MTIPKPKANPKPKTHALCISTVKLTTIAIFQCARNHRPHEIILICESSSLRGFFGFVSTMAKRLPRCELLTQNRNARLLHRGVIGDLCMMVMWRIFYLLSIYTSTGRRSFRDILIPSTSVHLSPKDVFSFRFNTSTRLTCQHAILEHSHSSSELYEHRFRSSSSPICIP